jgi:hypothetical protein
MLPALQWQAPEQTGRPKEIICKRHTDVSVNPAREMKVLLDTQVADLLESSLGVT